MKNPTRERRTNDSRQGDCHHKEGDHFPAATRWKPIGEIQDDSREKTCLGKTEQQPEPVKRPRGIHEDHHRGNYPPRDHDPCDPQARTKLLHQDVARDLENKISNEKNARSQPVNSIADRWKIRLHLQLREADIHSIEVGSDVADEQQRNNPPSDFSIDTRFRHQGSSWEARHWFGGTLGFNILSCRSTRHPTYRIL